MGKNIELDDNRTLTERTPGEKLWLIKWEPWRPEDEDKWVAEHFLKPEVFGAVVRLVDDIDVDDTYKQGWKTLYYDVYNKKGEYKHSSATDVPNASHHIFGKNNDRCLFQCEDDAKNCIRQWMSDELYETKQSVKNNEKNPKNRRRVSLYKQLMKDIWEEFDLDENNIKVELPLKRFKELFPGDGVYYIKWENPKSCNGMDITVPRVYQAYIKKTQNVHGCYRHDDCFVHGDLLDLLVNIPELSYTADIVVPREDLWVKERKNTPHQGLLFCNHSETQKFVKNYTDLLIEHHKSAIAKAQSIFNGLLKDVSLLLDDVICLNPDD